MVERLNKEALAGLFFREVEKLAQNEELEGQGKTEALYRLLTLLFIELTRRERLQFSTLFARIAYTCHKYQLNRRLSLRLFFDYRRTVPKTSAGFPRTDTSGGIVVSFQLN